MTALLSLDEFAQQVCPSSYRLSCYPLENILLPILIQADFN